MKEKTHIVQGFNGFEIAYDKENNITEVKYKGECLKGGVAAYVSGFNEDELPSLTLKILVDL